VKDFLIRILLAAALTLLTFGVASSAHAQQADEDPVTATAHQQQPATATKSPQQRQFPVSSDDAQTQEALAFTGRVTSKQGQLVLKDPVTKMTYQLDNQAKAKLYIGKKVKVIGILEMKSNTIHIDTIEPLS
jgi:outer membrane biogenesis lipoprotein LolB